MTDFRQPGFRELTALTFLVTLSYYSGGTAAPSSMKSYVLG